MSAISLFREDYFVVWWNICNIRVKFDPPHLSYIQIIGDAKWMYSQRNLLIDHRIILKKHISLDMRFTFQGLHRQFHLKMAHSQYMTC